MDEAMVEVAEQHEVRQFRRTTSRPGIYVVRSRPVDLAITTWESATSIPSPQRPSRRRRDHASRATDIDDHRVREQHARDGGVASYALQRARRNRQREFEVGRRSADLVLQALKRGRQVDVRLDAIAPRQLALIHRVVDQFSDRVGHPLLVAPLVIRPEPLGEGFQRGLERGTGLRVEDAIDGVHAIAELADF
jgi:hypothetical protein